MINITFNPKTYTLDVKGHSNFDEKGKDIVCAAISTLFYTLSESINNASEMIDGDIICSNEDGNGHLEFKPKEEYEANVSLICWTILNGFEMMAEHYKEYVTLSVE